MFSVGGGKYYVFERKNWTGFGQTKGERRLGVFDAPFVAVFQRQLIVLFTPPPAFLHCEFVQGA